MCNTHKKRIVITVTPRTVNSIIKTIFTTYICLSDTHIKMEDGTNRIIPKTYLYTNKTDTDITAGSTCYYINATEYQLDPDGISERTFVRITAHLDSNMNTLQHECYFGDLLPIDIPDKVCDEDLIRMETEFSDKYGWLYNQSSDLTKKHLYCKYNTNKSLMGKVLEDIYKYKTEISKTNAVVPYTYYPLKSTIGGAIHKEFTLFIDGDVEHKLLAFLDTVVRVVSDMR